jgi:hypothetical protein
MRDYAPSPNLLHPLFLNQSLYSMKRPPHLERADALEILAFEEQSYLGLRRFLAFPLCALERFSCLWCRCKVRQRRIGLHSRQMYVWFYDFVGCDDGLARQRWGICK